MRRTKVFRDAVHGDIELELVPEVELVDTKEFQRLRGIRQLGTAYLVYPGAQHTRFEHSLGTCWLASRLVDGLEQRGFPVDEGRRRAIRVAALAHDLAHVPFGHTLEDERRVLERHDRPERMRRALARGEFGRRLAALGLAETVGEILEERSPEPWSHQVISGAIGADLLDYLARDAYFCGLVGRYDPRIFRHFIVDAGGLALDAQKDGVLREDVISECVNLLRLRYFLSERVYFHHTKTASGAMLSRAVEFALEDGLDPEVLHEQRDEGLLALLRGRAGKHRALAALLDQLEARALHKRCYLLTRRVGEKRQASLVQDYHADRPGRERAEKRLEKTLRLRPGELIVYCPAAGMALKEADVRVKLDRGAPRLLSALSIPEIDGLLEKHRDLWKFYVLVHPRHRERFKEIAAACEEFFAAPNHLPALESGQLYLGFD